MTDLLSYIDRSDVDVVLARVPDEIRPSWSLDKPQRQLLARHAVGAPHRPPCVLEKFGNLTTEQRRFLSRVLFHEPGASREASATSQSTQRLLHVPM